MNVTKTLSLGAVLALCAQIPVLAEIKINDNFAVEGYGAVSARWMDFDSTPDIDGDSSVDVDASRLLFTGTMDKVTAKAGVYFETDVPGDEKFTLLDIYATYKASDNFAFTAGNFLTWLGYEAFHPDSMTTLTYANGDFLGAIPGYHSGVRFEFTGEGFAAGLAAVDSIYGPNAYRGDGELDDDAGIEAYATFTGVENFTLFGGVAHQTSADSRTVYDLWAQYVIGAATVAGEFTYHNMENTPARTGYCWLANLNYGFTEMFSTDFRVSGETLDSDPSFFKYTVAPAVALSKNFIVRGEVSYYDYEDAFADSAIFVGGQVLFKF
ncbi:MAG: outer membrane beta-barrel protein [Verrucomicrobiota bacterium]|nr:outer membrane beta-barrel protein [Verrucomicrobiota bacterium]